ncbi:endonuclease YncB(thermonuclease family) [Neisseria sp. HSC-16F19]|nr:thermonuclease family protein [Neisseria sp. HSC-16F19]MCP2041134.1 endonuclease YncB(thermonuclease family) [Neisseria sp. HSC-16F19]
MPGLRHFLLALLLAVSAPTFAQTACKVIGVADGDTINCLTADKQTLRVRLDQIDAPEKNQAYGQASRKRLSDLVYGKNVILMQNGKDRYGRVIAEVHLGGQNINMEMVRSGHAWAYREYLKNPGYLSLEKEARAKRQGLWADPNPIYPRDFRR